MKKIYRLKLCVLIASALFVILCGVDYMLVRYFKKDKQILWPVYHWSLGFEKIPKYAYYFGFELASCNGELLNEPVSIREFAEKNNIRWHHSSHYKYGYNLFKELTAMEKYPEAHSKYHSRKKEFEAVILSKLPCDTMKYNLISVSKNLITGAEREHLIKQIEYIKYQ